MTKYVWGTHNRRRVVRSGHYGLVDPTSDMHIGLVKGKAKGHLTSGQVPSSRLHPKRPGHSSGVIPSSGGLLGGAEEIRTPDPLHAMEVRYQLRHSPARLLAWCP